MILHQLVVENICPADEELKVRIRNAYWTYEYIIFSNELMCIIVDSTRTMYGLGFATIDLKGRVSSS